MHQQALEPANCADITTTRGLVDALLQLEHVPLDAFPGDGVPSIHRSADRGHSVLTATRTFTVHVAVPPSAYPLAFPRALASETIPLPTRMRLTPTPHGRWRTRWGERVGSYSVPGSGLALHLGSHCPPGYLRDATWIMQRIVQPFPMPVLGQADHPRRLVPHHDGSDVSLCTYPYATVLDGIPWWVQSYRLSGPLHRFDGQSPRGACASLRHLEERNLTSTGTKSPTTRRAGGLRMPP